MTVKTLVFYVQSTITVILGDGVTVSTLVFYSHSTVTVISGRLRDSKYFSVLRPVNQYGYIR